MELFFIVASILMFTKRGVLGSIKLTPLWVVTSSRVAVVRGFVVVVVVVVVIAIADLKNVNVINMGTPCPVSI